MFLLMIYITFCDCRSLVDQGAAVVGWIGAVKTEKIVTTYQGKTPICEGGWKTRGTLTKDG